MNWDTLRVLETMIPQSVGVWSGLGKTGLGRKRQWVFFCAWGSGENGQWPSPAVNEGETPSPCLCHIAVG